MTGYNEIFADWHWPFYVAEKHRNTPLTAQQKAQNKMYSSTRYVVERTFGLPKLHHELGQARYMGLARNQACAKLIAMSHHLKAGMNIFKQMRLLQESCA